MTKLRVVVFDLDGTLIDSVPDLTAALNTFFRRHAYPSVSEGEVRGMMGDGAVELLARCLAVFGMDPPASGLRRLSEAFLAFYDDEPGTGNIAFPHAGSVLRRLREEGFAIGVCTNKSGYKTRKILADLDLSDHVDAVVGAGDTDHMKPHPAPLEKVLQQLGLTGQDCVMVGDSINDVSIGRAVGAVVAAARYGYPRQPADLDDADIHLSRIEELPEALAEWEAARS